MNERKGLTIALLFMAVVALHARSTLAQSAQPGLGGQSTAVGTKSKDLIGSWLVTVTPQGAPSFQALKTFDAGGGLVASAQGDILLDAPPGVAPVASTAHGAWIKTGKGEFLVTFRQIFYGSDGSFEGGAKIRLAAALNPEGDEWSGQFKVEYFDAAGNVVFAGEGTMQASRIVPEPLEP